MTESGRPYSRLACFSAGDHIPGGDWQGRLISIHAQAINILHPSSLVVSLVVFSKDMTALSIRLESLRALDGLRGRAVVGARVVCTECVLSFSEVTISFERAARWSGTLERRVSRQPSLRSQVRRRTSFRAAGLSIARALRREDSEGGFASIVDPTRQPANAFAARAADILRGAEQGSATGGLLRLESLVGLGVGLTPSGDDFITGALLGERIAALSGRTCAANPRRVPRIERSTIESRSSTSTPPGRTLLWLALRDSFPAYLLSVARVVLAPGGAWRVGNAVRLAALHGATSGTDACAGLAWYLSGLMGRQRRRANAS